MVNTDNRLLANAARLRLEPILAGWVSEMQRGFVGGRSILANVLDVNCAMQQAALEVEEGMGVF